MIKKMLRRIVAVVLAVIMLTAVVLPACAETSQYVPYESYTYWDDISGAARKLVYNRPMYETENVFDAKALGIPALTELVDVCVDIEGNVYLLDTGGEGIAARVIMLDPSYKFIKEFSTVYGATKEDGSREEMSFSGASDVYVHTDKTVYICDTNNQRVLQCDLDGNYIDEYTLPDSPLIPTDFDYRPVKVVADSRGFVYILSQGSYYGALLYAPATSGTAKEFIGFYGANAVVNNILGAIQAVLNRMFPNNEKKANSQRVLPYTFSDIVIDSKDFIYTTTNSENKGQVKKLNPGAGNNILDSDTVSFCDDAVNRTYWEGGGAFSQKLTGLAVDDDEFMYVLDSAYGRVLVYDAECRMMTSFGGGMNSGTQKGTFQTASAVAVKETRDAEGTVLVNDVLIADKLTNTLTVFRRNDYGNLVMGLTRLTIDGDYIESRDGWEEVLKLDKNLQVAYTGLARAYLAEDKYEEAMDIALEGYDRETYALAYEYHRQNLISKYFTLIFTVVVVIAAAAIIFAVVRKKKGIVSVAKDSETRLALRTLLHPGLVFEEIKDKKRGSRRVALVILTLFYVSAVVEVLWGGFLFTNYDPGSFNSLWVFVQSFGLVVLWVVANWLVTTLAGGKGKMKEIFIVTCYSLMPMILSRVLYIILTNFLLPTEGSFLGILTTVAMIYTGLILTIGMIRIHDFTMTRFVGTTLLTLFAMAAIVFLIILVAMLLQQLGGFITTVFVELIM